MTRSGLLFPATVVSAFPKLKGGPLMLRRNAWSFLCLFLLPVIYLGLLGEFAVGQGSVIPPSLVVLAPCMLLFTVFAAAHPRRLRRFPLLVPTAWYLLAACLSGWHSVSHLHWIRGLMELGLALCFLMFPYFFLRTRRQLELCLQMLVLLASGTVVFAVLQAVLFARFRGTLLHLYHREDLWWIVGWGWRGRLAGNWVHPSYLGSVLNVAAPFALLHYLRAESRVRRALSLAAYIILAAGIALTATRTPVLAFLAASLAFVLLIRTPPRACIALAAAFTVAVGLSIFHFRFAPPDVGSRAALPRSFALAERLEFEKVKDKSTLWMRWNTQAEALALFPASPVFGIGMRNYPDRARGDPMAEFSIHNSLVQNLTELGLFGLGAFVVLIACSLRTDFRPKLSRFPELRSLRAALFCSSLAILLESLAENSLAIWQVLALFWLIRGISLMLAQHPAMFLNRGFRAGRTEQAPCCGSGDNLFDSLPVPVG